MQSRRPKPGYATTHPNPGLQSVPPGQSRTIPFQSIYKQLDCQKPGNKEEYEFCQQWRSAESAAQQACVSELQFWIGGWIGIFGLAGLLGTIFFTARSAHSASAASEQMKIGNAHQQGASATELRPYVFRETFSLNYTTSGPNNNAPVVAWTFVLVWKNCGQTPAKNLKTWLSADGFPRGQTPASINFPDQGTFESEAGSLGPGQPCIASVTMDFTKLVQASRGAVDFYYWGWVEYDGFADAPRHRTEICARLLVPANLSSRDARFLDRYTTRFNAADADCVHKPKTPKGQ